MKTKRIIIFLTLFVIALLCLSSCDTTIGEKTPESNVYHTVTFNFNNGDEIYSTQVEDGQTVAQPISPERENYIFNGWKAAGKYWDFSVQRVYSDTAFVAQWIDASSIFSYATNDDGTVTLTAYNGKLAEIRIPEKISGMTVSGIGEGVFEDFSDETAKIIVLPKTVTSIGARAFRDCTEQIVIMGEISKLGESAFENASKLKVITLSDTLSEIPFKAFSSATALTEITLPKSVTAISEDAFMNCTALRSLVISSPTLSVGNSAFSGCTSLVTVFYTESQAEWEQILLGVDNGGNGNDYFNNVKTYYYSESEPESAGDFWYYNDKNEPRCWLVS
ncbi:MAG: leucine-rich repeat protein [Clostridia bacterium]|nr:leucine-rich repeat protein [Clostridia bacterium]